MDVPLILLAIATCIFGSCENNADLPDQFHAESVEEIKHEKKTAIPYFASSYENIHEGKIYGTYSKIGF